MKFTLGTGTLTHRTKCIIAGRSDNIPTTARHVAHATEGVVAIVRGVHSCAEWSASNQCQSIQFICCPFRVNLLEYLRKLGRREQLLRSCRCCANSNSLARAEAVSVVHVIDG